MGNNKKLSVFAIVTTLFAILSFSGATYAWFTNNAFVNTGSVTATALSEAATLMISQTPEGGFTTADSVSIRQLNDTEVLLPVSTWDMSEFYVMHGRSPVVVKDEKYFYHGRIYLTAQSENPIQWLEIWLDGTDSVVTNATGDILNAARVGFRFDYGEARMFYLSEAHNAADDQIYNTYINGVLQGGDSIVLNSLTSVAPDPSVALGTCAITRYGSRVVRGAEPLGRIRLGEVVPVDVYFWLEGCDPDCSDHVALEKLDLSLRFYGVVGEEAN